MNKANISAICKSTFDGWYNRNIPELVKNNSYTLEYAVIGKSLTKICVSELPDTEFNSVLFSFKIGNDIINLVEDFREIKSIVEKNYKGTIIIIYSNLSEKRLFKISKKYYNVPTFLYSREEGYVFIAIDHYSNKIVMAKTNSEETLQQLKEIEEEVDRKVNENLKDIQQPMLGFCHVFWNEKKRILKEEYNIEWFSPAECNPQNRYD